jgi:hypothetical protein
VGWETVYWDAVGAALREHGKGLRRLKLDTYELGDDDDEPVKQPMGSLESFHRLEHLEVEELALLGLDDDLTDGYPNFEQPRLVEILPKSLKTLTIIKPDADTLDNGLADLLEDTRFTKLRSVKIDRASRSEDSQSNLDTHDILGWTVSEKQGTTRFRRII